LNKKAKLYGTIVLAAVAVVAIAGLIMNFTGLTALGWLPVGTIQAKIMPTCLASDGKKMDPFKQNYLIFNNDVVLDRCEGRRVLEAVCSRDRIAWEAYDCAIGMRCEAGACI